MTVFRYRCSDGVPMRAGTPFAARFAVGFPKPRVQILGTGFSGVVAGVGNKVSRFKLGDAVYGDTAMGFGANAEYLVVDAENAFVLKKPAEVAHAEAATWGDGAVTAYNFLFRLAGLQSGQKVLIVGAAGAIGSFAVQFARAAGAKVAALGGPANQKFLKSLGADTVINYHQQDITRSSEKFDLIFDTVGAMKFSAARRILTSAGTYMSPKLSFSLLLSMISTKMFGKKRALFTATGLIAADAMKALALEMTEFITRHKIKTIVDANYSLEDVPRLHAFIDKGHKKGSIAVAMGVK